MPFPKAPPSLNLTAVVVFAVPTTSKVIFANTPSVAISSSPIVLSRNTKLTVPFVAFILLEKFTGAFTTISPAVTFVAFSCALSYPT